MQPLLLGLALIAADPWQVQPSGTKARLRGISAASPDVAWASGNGRDLPPDDDGGASWRGVGPPGTSELDFRDVHAADASTAYLLSIGEGPLSRIYKTTDGGAHWSLSYQNRDPKGFLDAIAFFDADHGLALGDPVDARYAILATDDGGGSWAKVGPEGMPRPCRGEGAFAASGTCLVVRPESGRPGSPRAGSLGPGLPARSTGGGTGPWRTARSAPGSPRPGSSAWRSGTRITGSPSAATTSGRRRRATASP